jgi:hypothetical protein
LQHSGEKHMLCRAVRPAAEVRLKPAASKDTYLAIINTEIESKSWTRRAFQTWGHTKISVIRRAVSSAGLVAAWAGLGTAKGSASLQWGLGAQG